MKAQLLRTLLKSAEIKSECIADLLDCIDEPYQENALSVLLGLPKPVVQPFNTKTFPDTEYFKNIKVLDVSVNYLRNEVTVRFRYNNPSDDSDIPKVRSSSRTLSIDSWNQFDIIEF